LGIAADFVLIVVAGLIGGILARALRLPLLVGYIVAGVVVGPHTAGPTVTQIHDIETLAEIGVALLLFSLGLEVSFRDLQVVRRVALLGGPIQILLTIAAGATAAVFGLGIPVTEAIWVGAMTSVSSTMVVLKVLAAGGVTSTLASRVMIGLLLVQDLAVVPMLIILPQLGTAENLLWRLAASLAVAGALLLAVFVAGTRLLPSLLRRILGWGSRELFLVAVVAIGVGVGAAFHAAGFSFAVGAFVAGLILSESEFSHQALSDVVPLRDIFGLLFFVSVGMLLEPRYAFDNAPLIAVAVTLIFVTKALIFGVTTRLFGYWNMAPWVVGLGLSQIGEFSFVLARVGYHAGSITKPVYDLALTATVLTMALSPLVSALALPLGRAWQRWRKPRRDHPSISVPAPPSSGHVVVAGYGRTGRAVARALREAAIPCLVIEFNHSLIADLAADGFSGIWGDISREEILHAARLEQARMLVLTMPDHGTACLAIGRSRRLNPELVVIARSTRIHHLEELRGLGVSAAVQPEYEGGLEMVRLGLAHFGHDEARLRQIVDSLRAELYSGTAS
jgi:CPA2 family monovalent cation:H+ antiporter-2